MESHRPDASGDVVVGVVERITFHSPESGYTVLRLRVEGEDEPIAVVGHAEGLTAGAHVRVTGRWAQHPRHGPQFLMARHEAVQPDTLNGIERYLGSGLIKGIGPRTARRLVDHFGLQTLEVLDHHPERLAEVRGLGQAKAAVIRAAWEEQRSIRDVMLFLQAHGVSSAHAVQIFRAYGAAAVAVVKAEPYRLAAEVRGIGFLNADRIAARLGVAVDDAGRLAAGLLHAMAEASSQGHLAQPTSRLLERSSRLLGLQQEHLRGALKALVHRGELREEADAGATDPLVWTPQAWETEHRLAERLGTMLARPAEVMPDVAERLAALEAHRGWSLSGEQRRAVLGAVSHRVFVLTGGPGTGKTTTLRAIVALLDDLELVYRLTSPTGRAARRLAEVTGSEARTLHRLLEYAPDSQAFSRGPGRPIEADVVIVDEASMLESGLACALVEALPPLATLILVGDADQLPSVGPGNVLRDLLDSRAVPVAALTEVFRQAEASEIVRNAHRIREGLMPSLVAPGGGLKTDCYFLEAETPDEALRLIENVVVRSLPARFGLDPVRDILVLTPMNRGPVGTVALNQALRDRLAVAGPGGEPQPEVRGFRPGDRVIQRRNDYERQVFNGDLGVVEHVDVGAQEVTVALAEGTLSYGAADLDDLAHAWAITVHKSQGSEFSAVVLALMAAHEPMLMRNLLYTGLTRARQVAVIVGQRRALEMAVRRGDAGRRVTRLAERLRGQPHPV